MESSAQNKNGYEILSKKEPTKEINEEGHKADKDKIESAIFSHSDLSITLGLLGISLPIVLFLSSLCLNNRDILPSISDYYYSRFSSIFTGILIATGVFFIVNQSENKREKTPSKIAGICAILTALIPTHVREEIQILKNTPLDYDKFDDFVRPSVVFINWAGHLHLISALVFFITLIWLITKFFMVEEVSSNLKSRYQYCAIIMTIAIGIIFVNFCYSQYYHKNIFNFKQLVFTFETIALLGFGIAWISRSKYKFSRMLPSDRRTSLHKCLDKIKTKF